MADLFSYGNSEREFEQALITLKKGTQLIKYSRKGKPKFCPFRISTDETTLIWFSHGKERNLKLASVTRIIPGQRTPVFRRYLRPEKDYLSFSLIYNNGERSLDLICKDKVEIEVWFAGLKALISSGKYHNRRTKSDISDSGHPFGAALDFTSSIVRGRTSCDLNSSSPVVSSDVGSEHSNMQLRTSIGDGIRLSISSTPSSSSQGSGPKDADTLGEVYVWGELLSDGVVADGSGNSYPIKTDVLTPKPLETKVDVQQISCGVRHFAIVTRQGEVFTWGEDSGGALGHGIEKDFSYPHHVDYLTGSNVDSVACGEYHTCALSTSGDVFSWGDGRYNAGLLGHNTDISHWIPNRISGPLEGLQVVSVACGTWHSALTTSNGKLFTFGDGTYGVLGHGDRKSIAYPKEVEQLRGLKTLKVACGVWQTVAIVEVFSQSGSNVTSRKLFTWGDGTKYRLGHGNKETYLLPTCVSALIDYNFQQIACGNDMTVALTTSGHVFTMGDTAYGQLGSTQANGVMPCLIQERLVGEFVESISCGAYHVAVLTARNEVFTWGRGLNGRLGHGDTEDRPCPTMVEALKDRQVRSISCGSNFTASICTHRGMVAADQTICAGCKQSFSFAKKKRNCCNCGLLYCHSCTSKKAIISSSGSAHSKPQRVCDTCYAKLNGSESGSGPPFGRKSAAPRHSMDIRDRPEKREALPSRFQMPPIPEPSTYLVVGSGKSGAKADSNLLTRPSQVPSFILLKDITFPNSLAPIRNALRPQATATPPPPPPPQPTASSRSSSRSSHPRSTSSRQSSPLRYPSPIFSRSVIDSLKKTNEILQQEVMDLQNQVKNLKHKCSVRDNKLQKLQKNAIAKDVVENVVSQLKEMSDKLPPEVRESETFKAMHAQIKAHLNANATQGSDSSSSSLIASLDQKRGVSLDDAGVSDPSQNSEGRLSISDSREVAQQVEEMGSRSHEAPTSKSPAEKQVTEQFEPGVYVTLIQLWNGVKIFKRVRFSKKRFSEHQAEEWWKENKDRLLKKYSALIASGAPAEPSETPTESSGAPAPAENNEESAAAAASS